MTHYHPTLSELVATYRNTAEQNDAVHQLLTAATWADPLLASHRRHVEEHKLGFGDPAFHSMWARLLEAATERFGTVRALEIGVFKGQVISLWSLLAHAKQFPVSVSALTPLAGNPQPRSRLLNAVRLRLDRRFREQAENGNFYAAEDYEGTIRAFFKGFELDFDRIQLHRGLSTDAPILAGLANERFHLIYVDGDHTYEGARHDFHTFGPKVVPGGWLVADDAGCALPGTAFWKGHGAVSRAAEELPALGFRNVLNVGHNRIFERLP